MAQPAPTPSSSFPLKNAYLVLYNGLSLCLRAWILFCTLRLWSSHGNGAVWEELNSLARWTETLTTIEVIHAATGLVRAAPTTTALQVAGRNTIVWAITRNYPDVAAREWAYSSMLVAWNAADAVRYAVFALERGLGRVPSALVWLRYNMFFVLYPIGILSEAWLVYQVIAPSRSRNLAYQYLLYLGLAIYVPVIRKCVVIPSGDGSDDVPAILEAFQNCGRGGMVKFLNETYHIESVMNTTELRNCRIDLKGTLLWGTNISYWLANSLPMGYQNQSTAWLLGGENIAFHGYGFGTFDGNGQVWYDFINGQSNYPRRPHQLTITGTTDSSFEGLRFVQSQMWTMTVIHSRNVLLQDIYVSSRSTSGTSSVNTDGADTIYADNITFNRWMVRNGDDAISPKANSSNIFITNSVFYDGSGIALGSIGQYNGVFETIENVTADNITCINTLHAVYFKTFTGEQVGYPPNGGGGGLGHIKNVNLCNFKLQNVRNTAISVTQCTTFNGAAGDCNSSEFEIEDIKFQDVAGTLNEDPIAHFSCSGAMPWV
ncbi:hypothetical protein BP5796_12357 [Coleophoma crateriformis]|uniref:very-long-chain (3R)-3-hydroxyacyl-CoA dehydratase n=1 Tax=Coleophoma crateriformis TaxID=565419 RepID=A0A3D8Q9U1_9HELO|nr:hypothetical protein BP5796_12357 [Coleophoma crateriformis]